MLSIFKRKKDKKGDKDKDKDKLNVKKSHRSRKASKNKDKSKDDGKDENNEKHEKHERNGVKEHSPDHHRKEKEKQSPSTKRAPPKEPVEDNELITDLCSQKKVGAADFDLICVIGRGSFGKVMQVRHKETNKIYAMKTMKKENIIAKNQVTHTKDEKHILQKIKHPFIVNLNFAFHNDEQLYMILDYVNGGELFFHLKREVRFSEERAKFYAAEISSALIHLHENGIIYRDLKPENLLLDSEGHIVITDFGLSKEVGKDPTHTFCGTPEYLAPEVLLAQGHSFPVDWWSLGTLVYEMIIGLPPFFAEDQKEMYDKIVNGELVFPHSMSDEACDFLAGLLEKEPEKRYVPSEIMSHQWFEGLDWNLLEQKKIKPPWVPPVSSSMDRSMIDPEVQREDVNSKPAKGTLDLNEIDQDLFKGFTYEGAINPLDDASDS